MIAKIIGIAALILSCASAAHATEEVHANDNRRSAGRLTGDTLRLDLEAREGLWYPESTEAHGIREALGLAHSPLHGLRRQR